MTEDEIRGLMAGVAVVVVGIPFGFVLFKAYHWIDHYFFIGGM